MSPARVVPGFGSSENNEWSGPARPARRHRDITEQERETRVTDFDRRVLAAALLVAAVGDIAAEDRFKDIPRDHWAFEEVHWLRADGMLEGWGGEFHGDGTFNRYEMSQVLYRYMQKYYAERDRVDGELQRLESQDAQHREAIGDLRQRTAALEQGAGMAPGAVAAPVAPPRPNRAAVERMPAAPPMPPPESEMRPPIEVADSGPAQPAATAMPSGSMSLAERIAALKARVSARRRGEEPPIEVAPTPQPAAPAPTVDVPEPSAEEVAAAFAQPADPAPEAEGVGGDRLARLRARYLGRAEASEPSAGAVEAAAEVEVEVAAVDPSPPGPDAWPDPDPEPEFDVEGPAAATPAPAPPPASLPPPNTDFSDAVEDSFEDEFDEGFEDDGFSDAPPALGHDEQF